MDRYVAEFIGTFVLIFFGVGTVVFGGLQAVGVVGIALAFGLVLLVLVYALGPISGCHVNPAVTVGMLVLRRISVIDAVAYVVAQLLGAFAGAALIKAVTSVGGVTDRSRVLGATMYGTSINTTGAFIMEVVLTFLLVYVVLRVTAEGAHPAATGLAIGLTLTVIHLIGVPLEGGSVNPARSLGPAVFAGGDALGQIWLYIVAPLVGGLLAAGVAMLMPRLVVRRTVR